MKIYTKTGDSGETSLLGGKRTYKCCLEMDAIGEVDEINAYVGLIIAELGVNLPENKKLLIKIQHNLFIIGSNIAAIQTDLKNIPKITEDQIIALEKQIDKLDEHLPVLDQFILPGGHKIAAMTYIARTVCRRAERTVIDLSKKHEVDPFIKKYMNRLSDYLFTLGRYINKKTNKPEIAWKK